MAKPVEAILLLLKFGFVQKQAESFRHPMQFMVYRWSSVFSGVVAVNRPLSVLQTMLPRASIRG